MSAVLAAALIASSACAAGQELVRAGERCLPAAANWRGTATEDDRGRIRDWREAWLEALADARGEHGAEIAREGVLLDPDAALPDPLPPAGDYRCRTIKVGTPSEDLLTYIAYPPFRCRIRIEGDRVTFSKLTGSQRPIGRLFTDVDRRMIFLGTMQLGDERRAFRYGVDRERDMAGILERVGERRWRIAFPYPHFESLLDVIELTPED
jgi:Domain of unknown function (DUF4893)